MRFLLHGLKPGIIFIGMMIALICLPPASFAETRLFVPDFRFGAGRDTQLLISNNSDRDTSVDLWAFLKTGELLGQEQLRVKANGIRSLTLGEAFGSYSIESSGWLALVSDSDGLQMSYSLLGDRTEYREAEAWPKRELALDIQQEGKQVVRLSNTSSIINTVTLRRRDETGRFVGLQELSIGPFQQLELPIEALNHAPPHIDVLATSDILVSVGERTNGEGTRGVEKRADDRTLSLVIEGNEPVGAYQVLLRFDPTIVQFSQDDILGGSAAGFDSRPLAVTMDNASGQLRIASFQIGNEPQGSVDVAHIRVHLLRPSRLQFGITVEEITDLQGHSQIDSTAGIKLVRLK
ncbi:MAG: hypothetical protein DMG15_08190 [Acidobacteria bacterium]|nr:MAG: hypothetical protein DMG15_08190 [Acidobacteriota bacterium]